MPKYQIRITEIAEQELLGIVEYIASDRPVAALQLADDIERSIANLEDFSLLGIVPKNRRIAAKGYKVLIIHDYLVFYVIFAEYIEIRRILSGKRKYTNLL